MFAIIWLILFGACVIYTLYRVQYPRGWKYISQFDGPPLTPILGVFPVFQKCKTQTGLWLVEQIALKNKNNRRFYTCNERLAQEVHIADAGENARLLRRSHFQGRTSRDTTEIAHKH